MAAKAATREVAAAVCEDEAAGEEVVAVRVSLWL
jgi:hypothetical protein